MAVPVRLAALWPGAAGLAAFAGSLGFGFVFDDAAAVRNHPAIASGDFFEAAFGPRHSPISNRPLPCLSLCANHAFGGFDPWGYHLVNLLLHAANAVLLWHAVRLLLRSPNLAGSFAARRATGLATAIATVWAAHPLGCDAVAYVTQRTTLLAATCLLAALWAWFWAATSPRRRAWEWASVGALALGMASKEELALAPPLLILADRAFLQPSWQAWRQRWPLHLRWLLTWAVLAACVLLGPRNPTVGWDTQPASSAFEWLLTQADVLVHYARLSLLPWPLRPAYDWPIVRDPAAALWPGLLVLLALLATVWLWRRRPWWGWLGAWFFLLLAPTSSVLPIVTEVVAERRMYLPMLALVAPAVIGAAFALERLAGRRATALGAAALALVATTAVLAARAHAQVYRDEAAFWRAAAAGRDLAGADFQTAMILTNLALVLRQQGETSRAHELLARAVASEAPTPAMRLHHAVSLAEQGRRADAEQAMRALLRDDPGFAEAAGNLATLLLQAHLQQPAERRSTADPALAEAEALLARAAAGEPLRAGWHNSLGWLRELRGEPALAEQAYRRACALDPARPEPAVNLVRLLLRTGRLNDARAAVAESCRAAPAAVPLRLALADQLWQHDRELATGLLLEVLRLDPGNAAAAAALAAARR